MLHAYDGWTLKIPHQLTQVNSYLEPRNELDISEYDRNKLFEYIITL